METTTNKYSRGKIYTIRCKTDDSLVYVGSTIDELRRRWCKHKCHSKTKRQRNLHDVIESNGGFENWYIELLEKYACNDCSELNKREGELIRQYGTLNKRIAGRTVEEYLQDKKDVMKEKRILKKIDNPDIYAIRQRNYRLNNIEKVREADRIHSLKRYKNIKELETPEQREERVERKRQYDIEYKQHMKETETPEQKRERLDKANARRRELRQLKKQQQE